MRTAFIVLTYNRPDALLSVLRGLAPQCDSRHEVVIVDDGSTPETLDALRKSLPKFQCNVSYVWHPDTGFTASHSRNMGGASTSAEYLVFLDGDCIPSPRFVDAHTALMKPGYFVNGNRVLFSEKLTREVLSQAVDLSEAKWIQWVGWRLRGDANKLAHLLYFPAATFRDHPEFYWKRIRSCNLGVWRKDFVMVNGFDETFEGWGHEDADLVLRLHNAGLVRRNGFCATEVYHLWHRENSRVNESINRDRVNQRQRSGLVVAERGIAETAKTPDFLVSQLN
jgi:GT2 family glycosyltransferase